MVLPLELYLLYCATSPDLLQSKQTGQTYVESTLRKHFSFRFRNSEVDCPQNLGKPFVTLSKRQKLSAFSNHRMSATNRSTLLTHRLIAVNNNKPVFPFCFPVRKSRKRSTQGLANGSTSTQRKGVYGPITSLRPTQGLACASIKLRHSSVGCDQSSRSNPSN